MELHDIANRIQSNIKDGSFLLSDATTTGTTDVSILLEKIYKTTTLELTNATLKNDVTVILKGDATIDSLPGVKVTLTFEGKENNKIKCTINSAMPPAWKMKLDDLGLFSLDTVVTDFTKTIGVDDPAGTLKGKLNLSAVMFNADGLFDYNTDIWSVNFTAKEVYNTSDIIKAFNTYAKIDIPDSVIPNVNYKELSFSYESKGENIWDKLSLNITTDTELPITDNFKIESLGASFQKRNSNYSFTGKGDLVIASTTLPLYLQLRNNEFVIGVDVGDKGCPLPSLSDVGDLFNISDQLSIFPKQILDSKNFILQLLHLDVPYTFKSINQFYVTIKVVCDWELFGLDKLKLNNVSVGLYRQQLNDKAVTGFIIIASISISQFKVQISGEYSSTNGWKLSGLMETGKKLVLNDLLGYFADMLDIGSISSLPIPEIALYNVWVEFELKTGTFKCSAKSLISGTKNTTILDKLLNIKLELSLESDYINSVRTYTGSCKGDLYISDSKFEVVYEFDTKKDGNNVITAGWTPLNDKDVLTIPKILNFFGVSDVPEIINDLNFKISGVKLKYDITKKNLNVTIDTNVFKTISLVISDADYEVDIIISDDITLALLPIVGTYLHLLDDLAIQNLELYASSKDNKSKGTLAGAAITGSLVGVDFVLQVYTKEKEPAKLLGTELVKSNSPDAGITKWFDVNKNAGIFEFYRFGVGYKDGRIEFLIDASLTSQTIELGMLGLGIGLKISDPKDVAFELSGLKIDYMTSSLSIGGAFLKSTLGDEESYDGDLQIKTGDFALFAFGTYSKNSLFASALINKNFGGPPAFFVKGLSASFAYNMGVKIPGIDGVAGFPLVSGVLGNINKDQMLTQMKTLLNIEDGETFLAAGIKFTSFEMVNSFALLAISFGNELEINLLGLSEVSVPPNLKPSDVPIAYAQLALKATLNPSAGIFALMAQLTSESYILSKKCKLTGGFAFYAWFAGEHSGDFVLTLGGYNPNYTKPDHYPVVPRLGFNWDVTTHLKLSGNLYFALTPSVLMAGGRLDAVYSLGCISAWFKAEADFMIGWKPFFYSAHIYAGFGVSVRVKVLFVHTTIRVELSALLDIWGPEFSGKVRISLFIVSFTISFGAGASDKPPLLKWDEFASSFLPNDGDQKNLKSMMQSSDYAKKDVRPISAVISDGQIGQGDNRDGIQAVNAERAELVFKSAIPVTKLTLDSNNVTITNKPSSVYVRPTGGDIELHSELCITFTSEDTEPLKFNCELIYDNVPAATWGKFDDKSQIVPNVLVGIRLKPLERKTTLFPANNYIDLNQLSIYSRINRTFSWNPVWSLPAHSQDDPIGTLSRTINSPSCAKKRKELIDKFNGLGFDFDSDINLSKIASEADSIFTNEMILGELV